eukprot:TRINITY_DN24050_c0_g2_i4.p2 TRINITY_DN24050_c0_g2~~TRINITY_DN24050_c0_g2_i4.p2  ORF type:complete len:201 (-),score=7.34 TRINITY_DN24050_c0_g2_i4:359-961(-)
MVGVGGSFAILLCGLASIIPVIIISVTFTILSITTIYPYKMPYTYHENLRVGIFTLVVQFLLLALLIIFSLSELFSRKFHRLNLRWKTSLSVLLVTVNILFIQRCSKMNDLLEINKNNPFFFTDYYYYYDENSGQQPVIIAALIGYVLMVISNFVLIIMMNIFGQIDQKRSDGNDNSNVTEMQAQYAQYVPDPGSSTSRS